MKAASLVDLKKELKTLDPDSVLELFIRIVKYKKENKELLTYLLFEAGDEAAFIRGIKNEMDMQFEEMNKSNFYYAKKSIRKILRNVNKYIRYSGKTETGIELLIYFCKKIKESGLNIKKSTALNNIYQSQLKKIDESLAKMHEDLQYDYRKELSVD
jgi:membrane-anchored protein YejM (alkaline phosphatase superfamily)